MFQKRGVYRNKNITQAARGEECTLNYANCNGNTESTVFAHFNDGWAGKGMGQKADDCAGFFACNNCHDDYDNGRIYEKDKDWFLRRAYYRTIRRLIDKGILK